MVFSWSQWSLFILRRFQSMREIKTQAVNHLNGEALMQLCAVLILLTLLLTSLKCTRCHSNNDVKVSVILNFTRWWQLFTTVPSAVSTLELAVITSALATEHNRRYWVWILRSKRVHFLLNHTEIHILKWVNYSNLIIAIYNVTPAHLPSNKKKKKIMFTLCVSWVIHTTDLFLNWSEWMTLTPEERSRNGTNKTRDRWIPHISFISLQNRAGPISQCAKLTPYGVWL